MLVCAVTLGARAFQLDVPGEDQPTKGFVFDEKYYVNAARVIAGVSFPAADTYHGQSPDGTDPNGEHPQLGKLVIAAGIRVFGDNPVGWRIGALVFGIAAVVALWWLVLCLGGGAWLAVGAAALLAFDNLELVHGRIGVLDVYCLPLMLAAVALWLRRRFALSGLAIAVATGMKLFGAYALIAIGLLELFRLLRWLRDRGEPPRLGSAARKWLGVGVAVVACLVLLGILDHLVPAYSNGQRVSTELRPWDHLRFIYDYGKNLRSPDGPKGIASYPWQFWFDVEAANYFTLNTYVTAGGQTVAVNTVIAYQGMVNPVLLALWPLALGMSAYLAVRRRDEISMLVVAWVLATWLPPAVAWQVDQRTCYLYYMVVILPGVAIAAARLLGAMPRLVLGVWIGLFAAAFCVLYPFRDWALVPHAVGLG